MKQRHEIETTRAVIANIEMQQLRGRTLSPEQQAWYAGARAALSWVLELPRGGRKIDQFIAQVASGLPVGVVVNPFEGAKMLDRMRDARPEDVQPEEKT